MTTLLVWVIVLLGFASVEAAEGTRPVPPLVDGLLKLSGVTRQLTQLAEAIIGGFDQRSAELDVGAAETRRQILRDAYRADALYPLVMAAVITRYDEPHATAVVRAFRTPLFRRLQELEDAAWTPAALPSIRAFSEQLVDNRPSVERHVLVRRLDAAMGVTAIQLEVMGATIRGMSRALGTGAAADVQIRDLIAGVREQSMVPVKNQTLLTLLFAYRTVGDDELRDYLAFWESLPGRWFVTAVHTGIVQAMRQAAETAARRMKSAAQPAPVR